MAQAAKGRATARRPATGSSARGAARGGKASSASAAAKAKPASGAGRGAGRGAKASAAAAAPQAAIGLRQMAAWLAEDHDLPRRQVEALLGDLVAALAEQLKKGAKIRVSGLGIFQVRARPARMGRNPATGEPIQIKASKKIAFRPAKELKEAV